MPHPARIRQLLLPPKGRPHWLSTREPAFELIYLSWGWRWYGDAPIEPTLHEGWHYFIVVEGNPLLLVGERALRAAPGLACISHPDCPVGHADQPGSRCRMLTWIWRTPPGHSALRPPEREFIRLQLQPDRLRNLESLHAACSAAAAVADERSMLELRTARLQLDLALLGAREHRKTVDSDFRFSLAVEFLRKNPDELEPVGRLCEYLRISEASLKRLFHEKAGLSPRTFALDWRMRLARERLAFGAVSIKAVAYALGYRHPNDFSRAFKRYTGSAASQCRPGQPAGSRAKAARRAGAGRSK
jgi:AraC family transcriptional regulator of arabinose operon